MNTGAWISDSTVSHPDMASPELMYGHAEPILAHCRTSGPWQSAFNGQWILTGTWCGSTWTQLFEQIIFCTSPRECGNEIDLCRVGRFAVPLSFTNSGSCMFVHESVHFLPEDGSELRVHLPISVSNGLADHDSPFLSAYSYHYFDSIHHIQVHGSGKYTTALNPLRWLWLLFKSGI